MPIYQWKCSRCGRMEEVHRKVADIEQGPSLPPDSCEHCWERVPSATTFRLQGGGWFEGGYGGDK